MQKKQNKKIACKPQPRQLSTAAAATTAPAAGAAVFSTTAAAVAATGTGQPKGSEASFFEAYGALKGCKGRTLEAQDRTLRK